MLRCPVLCGFWLIKSAAIVEQVWTTLIEVDHDKPWQCHDNSSHLKLMAWSIQDQFCLSLQLKIFRANNERVTLFSHRFPPQAIPAIPSLFFHSAWHPSRQSLPLATEGYESLGSTGRGPWTIFPFCHRSVARAHPVHPVHPIHPLRVAQHGIHGVEVVGLVGPEGLDAPFAAEEFQDQGTDQDTVAQHSLPATQLPHFHLHGLGGGIIDPHFARAFRGKEILGTRNVPLSGQDQDQGGDVRDAVETRNQR